MLLHPRLFIARVIRLGSVAHSIESIGAWCCGASCPRCMRSNQFVDMPFRYASQNLLLPCIALER